MKRLILLISFIFLFGCATSVPPVQNSNTYVPPPPIVQTVDNATTLSPPATLVDDQNKVMSSFVVENNTLFVHGCGTVAYGPLVWEKADTYNLPKVLVIEDLNASTIGGCKSIILNNDDITRIELYTNQTNDMLKDALRWYPSSKVVYH